VLETLHPTVLGADRCAERA